MTAIRHRLRVTHSPFNAGFTVPIKVVRDGSVAKLRATLKVETGTRGSEKAPRISNRPGTHRRGARLAIGKSG